MSVQATNEMIETKHQQQQQQKSRRYHSMYNENDIWNSPKYNGNKTKSEVVHNLIFKRKKR